MNTNILKSLTPLAVVPANINVNADSTISYFIGSMIALFIMGYLVYSLLRPDKF
jgi:K+-transporting ATPase KdpF subunit